MIRNLSETSIPNTASGRRPVLHHTTADYPRMILAICARGYVQRGCPLLLGRSWVYGIRML
jgi:hypothetical protein